MTRALHPAFVVLLGCLASVHAAADRAVLAPVDAVGRCVSAQQDRACSVVDGSVVLADGETLILPTRPGVRTEVEGEAELGLAFGGRGADATRVFGAATRVIAVPFGSNAEGIAIRSIGGGRVVVRASRFAADELHGMRFESAAARGPRLEALERHRDKSPLIARSLDEALSIQAIEPNLDDGRLARFAGARHARLRRMYGPLTEPLVRAVRRVELDVREGTSQPATTLAHDEVAVVELRVTSFEAGSATISLSGAPRRLVRFGGGDASGMRPRAFRIHGPGRVEVQADGLSVGASIDVFRDTERMFSERFGDPADHLAGATSDVVRAVRALSAPGPDDARWIEMILTEGGTVASTLALLPMLDRLDADLVLSSAACDVVGERADDDAARATCLLLAGSFRASAVARLERVQRGAPDDPVLAELAHRTARRDRRVVALSASDGSSFTRYEPVDSEGAVRCAPVGSMGRRAARLGPGARRTLTSRGRIVVEPADATSRWEGSVLVDGVRVAVHGALGLATAIGTAAGPVTIEVPDDAPTLALRGIGPESLRCDDLLDVVTDAAVGEAVTFVRTPAIDAHRARVRVRGFTDGASLRVVAGRETRDVALPVGAPVAVFELELPGTSRYVSVLRGQGAEGSRVQVALLGAPTTVEAPEPSDPDDAELDAAAAPTPTLWGRVEPVEGVPTAAFESARALGRAGAYEHGLSLLGESALERALGAHLAERAGRIELAAARYASLPDVEARLHAARLLALHAERTGDPSLFTRAARDAVAAAAESGVAAPALPGIRYAYAASLEGAAGSHVVERTPGAQLEASARMVRDILGVPHDAIELSTSDSLELSTRTTTSSRVAVISVCPSDGRCIDATIDGHMVHVADGVLVIPAGSHTVRMAATADGAFVALRVVDGELPPATLRRLHFDATPSSPGRVRVAGPTVVRVDLERPLDRGSITMLVDGHVTPYTERRGVEDGGLLVAVPDGVHRVELQTSTRVGFRIAVAHGLVAPTERLANEDEHLTAEEPDTNTLLGELRREDVPARRSYSIRSAMVGRDLRDLDGIAEGAPYVEIAPRVHGRLRRDVRTRYLVAAFSRARFGAPSFGAEARIERMARSGRPSVYAVSRTVVQSVDGHIRIGMRSQAGTAMSLRLAPGFALVPSTAVHAFAVGARPPQDAAVDPDVYTRYYRDHRVGFHHALSLRYRPFSELSARLDLRTVTHVNPADPDRYEVALQVDALPLDGRFPWIALGYAYSYRVRDPQRPYPLARHTLHGRVEFFRWVTADRRLTLAAELSVVPDHRLRTAQVVVTWLASRGRGVRDLPVAEAPFAFRQQDGADVASAFLPSLSGVASAPSGF